MIIPEPVAIDARAKILWGENRETVIAFLQSKGVGDKDAEELIRAILKERAALIRSDGVRTALWGLALVALPVGYYYGGPLIGFFSLKVFSALIVVGVIGVVKTTKGLAMALRPRGVRGELADQGF